MNDSFVVVQKLKIKFKMLNQMSKSLFFFYSRLNNSINFHFLNFFFFRWALNCARFAPDIFRGTTWGWLCVTSIISTLFAPLSAWALALHLKKKIISLLILCSIILIFIFHFTRMCMHEYRWSRFFWLLLCDWMEIHQWPIEDFVSDWQYTRLCVHLMIYCFQTDYYGL